MNTEFELENETQHFGKQMLAAAADYLVKTLKTNKNETLH